MWKMSSKSSIAQKQTISISKLPDGNVEYVDILEFIFWHVKRNQDKKDRSYGQIEAKNHYNDVIMGAIASQITSLTIVNSTVYSDVDQRKHQNSASLAFVRGIHRGQVNSRHKWPVTRKIFPFDDVTMLWGTSHISTMRCRYNAVDFLGKFSQ